MESKHKAKFVRSKPALYAYLLKLSLIIAGIPLIIGPFLYQWLWKSTATFNYIKFRSMKGMGIRAINISLTPSIPLRLLAATVEGISVLLFLWGCIYFIKLLNLYCKGELFSQKILMFYRKIVWIGFLWTLYSPIKLSLLSVISTINNPAGQRLLSVTLRGEDIFHIFVVGSFLVLHSLTREAYKLKQEHDLTV